MGENDAVIVLLRVGRRFCFVLGRIFCEPVANTGLVICSVDKERSFRLVLATERDIDATLLEKWVSLLRLSHGCVIIYGAPAQNTEHSLILKYMYMHVLCYEAYSLSDGQTDRSRHRTFNFSDCTVG